MPASVCSAMLASTPCSSSKARCQATPPAPPVTKSVPSMSKRTARIAPGSLTQELLLAQPVEQPQRRQDEHRRDEEDDDHGGEGIGRRRSPGDLQRGRQEVGKLSDAPAPNNRDHGAGGERSQQPEARGGTAADGRDEDREHAETAEGGENDQRQALTGEAVEDIAGFGVELEQAEGGGDAGDGRGDQCAADEVALQLFVP